MSARLRSTGLSYVPAVPWRALAHRFSFLVFMGLALGLMIFARVQPNTADHARTRVIDMLAPVLDAFARPMTAASTALTNAKSYLALREENAQLRTANAQMKDWQNALANMERENYELRSLMRFKTEPRFAYISARVIADTGGPFARSLIVTAGKLDGVREGMAAITGDGLIGRVVEAGDWSSRVLLITDLNSRIPVTITGSDDRAILSGDNSGMPKLRYLSQDAAPLANARVVTSGHGGIFPPNLPIGNVIEKAHGEYGVVPAADLGRIDYVRLVDFNLNGGSFNPLAAKIGAGVKKH